MRSVINVCRRIHVSDDPALITIGELCAWLNVSRMWVARYVRDHGFPKGFQLGGPTSARRWRRTDVEAWLTKRAKGTDSRKAVPQ